MLYNYFQIVLHASQGFSLSKGLCNKSFSLYPLSPCILLLPLYISNIIHLFSMVVMV